MGPGQHVVQPVIPGVIASSVGFVALCRWCRGAVVPWCRLVSSAALVSPLWSIAGNTLGVDVVQSLHSGCVSIVEATARKARLNVSRRLTTQ